MYNASAQKSPVVYDLWESPFRTRRNGYCFLFSSMKHKERFDREVEKREEWLNDSLSRRFKVPVSAKILADVQLYIMVEGRGFAITTEDGVDFDSPVEFKTFVDVEYYG